MNPATLPTMPPINAPVIPPLLALVEVEAEVRDCDGVADWVTIVVNVVERSCPPSSIVAVVRVRSILGGVVITVEGEFGDVVGEDNVGEGGGAEDAGGSAVDVSGLDVPAEIATVGAEIGGGPGVAEGNNVTRDEGKVVCPDINTAHIPAKTTGQSRRRKGTYNQLPHFHPERSNPQ